MFPSSVNINDVGHAIQLALAPVFLLTGIAGLLNVMAARLARIIDRGRQLTESPDGRHLPGPFDEATVQELTIIERRRHFASSAITACTLAALLVCVVTAALFFEVLLAFELRWFIGLVFTIAALALVVGLAYFLREVHCATRTVRITLAASDPPANPK